MFQNFDSWLIIVVAFLVFIFVGAARANPRFREAFNLGAGIFALLAIASFAFTPGPFVFLVYSPLLAAVLLVALPTAWFCLCWVWRGITTERHKLKTQLAALIGRREPDGQPWTSKADQRMQTRIKSKKKKGDR